MCTSGGNSPIQNPTSGSPITVHIGGFIYGSNGPSYIVGAPGANIANFEAIGGCYDKHTNSGQLPIACDVGGNATTSGNSGIYSSGFTASTQVVTPPSFSAAQEASEYSLADPGPTHPCTPALSVGHVADEPLRHRVGRRQRGARHEPRHPEPDHATSARTRSSAAQPTEHSPGHPRQSHGAKACLHITGKAGVFLDGNFTMGGADYIQFDTDGTNACGTGTAANPNTYTDGSTDGSIYIDGTLTLTSDASICSHQDFNCAGRPARSRRFRRCAFPVGFLVDLQPWRTSRRRSRCRATRSSNRPRIVTGPVQPDERRQRLVGRRLDLRGLRLDHRRLLVRRDECRAGRDRSAARRRRQPGTSHRARGGNARSPAAHDRARTGCRPAGRSRGSG